MNAILNIELSKRHTQSFQDSVMHDHNDAMRCYDCEEMLEAGIKAYRTLVRVEKVLRDLDAEGLLDFTIKDEQWVCKSYENWLEPAAEAEKFIQRTMDLGFELSNLEEFNSVKEKALERIEENRLINSSRATLFNNEDEW